MVPLISSGSSLKSDTYISDSIIADGFESDAMRGCSSISEVDGTSDALSDVLQAVRIKMDIKNRNMDKYFFNL